MLFPISQLIAEKEEPLCISKNTKVGDALALMLENDFSQLPIVDEQDNLTGIITENSILRIYYHSKDRTSLLEKTVDHCQNSSPITIEAENDIFDALDLLQKTYAVVVVKNRKPIGILTDYDTTNFFRNNSEEMILVQDIEISLRQYIDSILENDRAKLAAMMHAFGTERNGDPTKPAREYEALTFGEYIQLITCDRNWEKFEEIFESKEIFLNLMNAARDIRNQLAHYRGRLEPIQLNALETAISWLAGRPRISKISSEQTVQVTPTKASIQKSTGKYAPLQDWLREQKGRDKRIQVSFGDIEKLLEEVLPASARTHRAWWANDYTSHVQSLAWLQEGWLVDDVDINAEQVVFIQSNQPLYQLFFADVIDRLRATTRDVTTSRKASLANWWTFSLGRSGFTCGLAFTKDHVLRIEIYIDTGDKEENNTAFLKLKEQKDYFENKIEQSLEWDILEDARACRIYITRDVWVTDPPEKLEAAKQWALEYLLKFVDAFKPKISELEI